MDATRDFVSLFSGCGGLDLGLESLGWRCVAQVENDRDCAALLEQRFPDVPNLGDVTKVDWTQVPPVEALAGGFPCQDLSYAGRGAGLAGDRSGLYYEMAKAIEMIRPRLVLIENVPGLLGRGLHVVTHDLARFGYVGTWRTLSSADLGAPHRRERVFVTARLDAAAVEVASSPSLLGSFSADGWESQQTTLLGAELIDRMPKAGAWTAGHVYEFEFEDEEDDAFLLPTPSAYESTPTDEFVGEVREHLEDPHKRLYLPGRKWHAQRTLSRIVPALLPTPNAWLGRRPENATADPERAKSREQEGIRGKRSIELPDAIAAEVRLLPSCGVAACENCGGPSQHAEVTKLLPTPVVTDSFGSHRSTDSDTDTMGRPIRKGREEGPLLPTPTATYPGGTQEDFLDRKGREPGGAVHLNHAVEDAARVEWGAYEPAIRRWEAVLGRPAPPPTDEKGRLAPAFVEWMLGFPEGWVVLPGAKRTAQLRMLGNAVQVQVAQVVGSWLAEFGGFA